MMAFYTYDNLEEEMQDFLRILYQDKKNGQVIQLRKDDKEVTQVSAFDLNELMNTGTDDAHHYTTVNSFRGWKRTSDSVFNYCSIFIDLDCHTDDEGKIDDAKKRTVEVLEMAYAAGELLAPTLITDTGRGFGIQYVLKRSIANVSRTVSQRAFFKQVRKKMFEKYREILSQDSLAAQPDPSVLDDSRVCRIPGTYNAAAGRSCRLICAAENYFELSDLVKGCHLWEWVEEQEYRAKKAEREKKKAAAEKVISFAEYRFPFLKDRVEQLMQLQNLRGKECTDACREQMLFIVYSALVQLDRQTAVKKLQEFNLRFVDPLAQEELDHIIEETNANQRDGYSGYYKLSNEYVIRVLALTPEEMKVVGIGTGWKRKIERQEARRKKEETREKVIGLLKKGDLTYAEIAREVGLSRRTICSIAKTEGLMRYAVAQSTESAKIATKSVCVPLEENTSKILLSTSFAPQKQRCEAMLDSLRMAAVSSVVATQLLRLTIECRTYPVLRSLVDAYFEHTPMQSSSDYITALDVFARWLIDATYGYGRFAETSKVPVNSWTSVSSIKKDYDSETAEERQHRIDGYLHKFKDERFEIIGQTEEYQKRIDPEVFRTVKTVFMQVSRLKRDTLFVEGKKVPTKEIIQAFENLTYKDIVILCERMEHKGTLQRAVKPFFYVVQTVWKYSHADAAKAQEERIRKEKAEQSNWKNGFHHYEQRDLDYDLITVNAIRRIAGLPELTAEEYQQVK